MIFRIYWQKIGGHTHMRVFAGRKDATLGKCGDLVMRNEEFLVFNERLWTVNVEFIQEPIET
jgi:hypothetical protein